MDEIDKEKYKSAFPLYHYAAGICEFGLSKREYFAAIALEGLLANQGKTLGLEHAAAVAINYADALIEELNK